ncbi:MAG: hypothetical protein K9L82_04355 [Chromatiaceae bacterium]|uniref:hypothetical protein n=1 Tax=Lamprobacter modestohalophilus TaxID=1064514 RepID=UPI001903C0E8|nr:hypothetical protein [Lamprobacter modestohalophilus]MCF7977235.1 hypothetical protein [Chromatiaceae bacterium]MCF7994590.1 hypothetical protein [Chromatiaceae bacterium]
MLIELLGNLLNNNACKWANSKVHWRLKLGRLPSLGSFRASVEWPGVLGADVASA